MNRFTKYDAARSAGELRQIADVLVAGTIGYLAASAFGIALPLAIGAAIVIFLSAGGFSQGALWKKPTARLAILALLLAWLLADWSAYRQGVFAGFDAAAKVVQR